MKKAYLFLVATALLLSNNLFAKTFQVDNEKATDKSIGRYASLQEAHDDGTNVTNGDTLLVQSSTKAYENLTCTKRLVIIGPGYFLAENGPNQADLLPALVSRINFNAGSEGSLIIGLRFSNSSTSNAPHISVSNIVITRCYLTNGITISNSISNLVVAQNYIEKYGISVSSTSYKFDGLILKNNIIVPNISITQYVDNPRVFAAVDNNIFLGNVSLITNSFKNNIIVNKTATVDVPPSSVQNNLMSATQLLATNGNQTYNETALFVGLEAANNSPDAQYALKETYKEAGTNGTQPGIFGGTEPYQLSGIPPIPTIYSIEGEFMGSKQEGLNVIIRARTNP